MFGFYVTTTAYSYVVLPACELRLQCGTFCKTTAYCTTSLQQSSCSDYDVHGGVNQPFDDHYFAVLVVCFRDNKFFEII